VATNWDYEQDAPVLNDTKVDNLNIGSSGPIDELPSLSIDIPDQQIIKNLDNRIQDSDDYWNTSDGFDLRNTRGNNVRLYQNKQNDVRSLYRYQLPYKENQIYIAEQAIIAYLTAQDPQAEVSPAQDTQLSKKFAIDLEKVEMAHSHKMKLTQIAETAVRNALNKRVGFIMFKFDPKYGKNGEIIPFAPDPEHCIVDKNARMGENPAFFCYMLKMTVNEACGRWPDKKDEIYRACGIKYSTYKQLNTVISVREVYLTYYDKAYEAHEALVYYFADVVLEKTRNPHWLYANPGRNFLDAPKKPVIALNFDNDGSHWIDNTSAVEQASVIQNVLNKRGRQLMEVADKANGVLIVSQDSGLTKDDLQELTGDPNQRLIIKTAGQRTQDMVYQVPPPEVPNFLYQDKVDLRTTVHAIMGTPSEFTGSNDGDADAETLGEALMKKNQASGRQDLYVRAIDRFMYDYFNMLTQMMVVWYNTDHLFVYNGQDGEFDHIVMNRKLIEDGIAVDVKSGTTLPFDKQRQEAIALQLFKGEGISLLDLYKLLHLPDPQKLYDNWAKGQTDPMSLARDAIEEVDDSKAYVAYVEIMAGKEAKEPDDCSKEFVLTLRKLMLRDEFLKADKKFQTAFLKYVDKAITSLELRTSLDQMSQQGGVEALNPANPIPPPQPPVPPMSPIGGMPGVPPPMGGIIPSGVPGGVPTPQPGSPPSAIPGPVTNGTPLPNPANPQIPPSANPSSLPVI